MLIKVNAVMVGGLQLAVCGWRLAGMVNNIFLIWTLAT